MPINHSVTRLSYPQRPFISYVIASRKNLQIRNASNNASDKLFADAAREEAEAAEKPERTRSRVELVERQHENWTGDESVQDAVLRMLVDKYKPLRSGAIISAEQKLKQHPPKVFSPLNNTVISGASVPYKPASGSWANEPLLSSDESHRPWHTEFKAPSHDVSSVKLARLPPSLPSRVPRTTPLDEHTLRKEKEAQKKIIQAGRLTQARESTLDYRLGIRNPRVNNIGRANPVSVKGWNSLVEDKIEKARMAGLFKLVKGRGQPLEGTTEERNPFIAREEFLMNRIVQRNGAAPPWVEVQAELDSALNSFREILRQSWIRRAIRILTTSNPPELLRSISLNDIRRLRDPEWLKREQSYHDVAIEEVNSLVRKYNGLAPYAVRRAYYVRDIEVERLYEGCAEEILRALQERLEDPGLLGRVEGTPVQRAAIGGRASNTGTEVQNSGSVAWGFGDLLNRWFDKIMSRWKA